MPSLLRTIPFLLSVLALFSRPILGQVETLTSESDLIAILAKDSTGADKAMACKRLAVYGSAAAVPELAKLLGDERLASWTRIALEAIPGSACNDALRQACGSLQGNLLIGVINSIGVRRDTASVDTLVGLLQNSDVEVAAAAAVALGKIGNAPAADALRSALSTPSAKVRSAVAQGCVLCAERFFADGNSKIAAEIFDQVRQTDVAKQRIVEATRGAILARQQQGLPLLIEQLRSADKALFQVGLQTAREMSGKDVATALVAEIGTAPDNRAALMVQALADLKGTVDQQALLRLAAQGSKEVRIAALGAIGRIGDAACVAPLIGIAVESSDLYAPVKAALVEIPDDAVNKEVLTRLPTAQGDIDKQLLVEVVGLRRIEATEQLVAALRSSKALIRSAALESMGSTVSQQRLPLLVEQVINPQHAEDSSAAQQALKAAAVRMPDREACAKTLSQAINNVPPATKVSLLEIIAAVGGSQALQTVGQHAKGRDVQLRDTSTDLLGKWMTIDAAPVLLDLARTGPVDRFQGRTVRGYIRIARQFVMSDEERAKMCNEAMAVAKQGSDRTDIINILTRYPSIETLKAAIQFRQNSSLEAQATKAALEIGAKLAGNKEAQQLLANAGINKS